MLPGDIAIAFSNGLFKNVYPHLTDDVEWTVIGERYLKGRQAVIDHCEQVAAYFNSVETVFKITNVIVDKHRVAINGTAEFIKAKQRLSFVHACDVYEFNNNLQLERITSYCIQQ